MRAVDELAWRYGMALTYHGIDGTPFEVPKETRAHVLSRLGLDLSSEAAVARTLEEAQGREPPVMHAGHKPCFLPDWLEKDRAWGISLQLYELRSRRNFGIGDFADLSEFCRIAAAAGADFVGLNPLHALFLADPRRRSPFSPSNRAFLNPIYIAPDRLPGYAPSATEDDNFARLREADLVDYEMVTTAKLALLRRIWRSGEAAGAEFKRFREEGGEALSRHALFEALSARMVADGHGSGWMAWPEEFRRVGAPAVRDFAEDNGDEVDFHIWLQFLADRQLREAGQAAREAGLRVGLYLDFAVGEAPDGSATWGAPELFVADVSIGAPPDVFTSRGQDWGLSPLSPLAVPRSDYAHYRRMIDASMRYAGALRLDHVMGLWQLFFIPFGQEPAAGTYLRYPLADLLGVLAELSAEHRSICIGEDLGNVPNGFREVMAQARILSYRILYFEERHGRFLPPEAYPRLALACLSTHDLPTMKGWWRGDDIALRLEHGLIDEDAAANQRRERQDSRAALVRILREAGALAAEVPFGDEVPDEVVVAANRFVAMTPSLLAGIRLADLLGDDRPTNLPGTIDSYPNWQPRLGVALEEMAAQPLFRAITQAVAAERPRE